TAHAFSMPRHEHFINLKKTNNMKKLLFLTIALAMFASCQRNEGPNDDNSTLVSGIVMPTEEFKTNDPVTIKGKGFIKGDAISLRAAVKSSDINVVVTEVTESQLIFTMPYAAAGKMNVVLKRDAKEQILGEITIAIRPPAKIYGLSALGADLYEIDPATGIATHMLTFADGYKLYDPLVIGHTMFATGRNSNWSDSHIVSYNLDTKEFKKVSDKISNQHAYDALGVIDGKLHVLAVVDDIVKLISIDSVTNAKTEVADFGKLDNPICVNGWNTYAGNGFAYDAKNNKIIIEGYWDGIQADPETDSYHQTVVLDLSNNTIKHLDRIINNTYGAALYLIRGSRICSIHEYEANGYLDLLDDKYQVESKLVSIANPSSLFAYDAVEDMLYLYVSNGWCSVDLKTTPATSNTVKCALQPIWTLFVVR
ncbi:MAG: IPT/TIG domain-containing protein, partial [Muribaculaceae bacterium]